MNLKSELNYDKQEILQSKCETSKTNQPVQEVLKINKSKIAAKVIYEVKESLFSLIGYSGPLFKVDFVYFMRFTGQSMCLLNK